MPYIKMQITREGASAAQKAAWHEGRVRTHPVVIGELACGTLQNRTEQLALLQEWPSAPVATDAAALGFSARHGLIGRGIGYFDVYLLAATALADPARQWTRDKRLAAVTGERKLAVDAMKN